MLTVKVPFKEAQKVKKELLERDLFAKECKAEKGDGFLYIPIKEEFASEFEIVERPTLYIPSDGVVPLKVALKNKIPSNILEEVKTAYDTVGDIAILEIDEEFKEYEKIIGKTLLSSNKKLATALAKDSHHEGTFRTQKMRLLAGVDKRVSTHKENNITLEVNVEEVYFSSRLSTERKRIAELVQPQERVLVCFSGCGPYTCVLAKNTEAKEVIGIEINPEGHKLAESNIKRNKLKNAKTFNGDVHKVLPELLSTIKSQEPDFEGFDRILMPLPKSAEDFLDTTLKAAKKGTTVHFYAFLHEDEIKQAYAWIDEAAKRANKEYKLQNTVKCGQQAPRVFRFCIDFQII